MYFRVHMGVTSGSFAGRDDGYPEIKVAKSSRLEDLVGKDLPEQEFFEAQSISPDVIKDIENTMRLKREAEAIKRKKALASAKSKLTSEEIDAVAELGID